MNPMPAVSANTVLMRSPRANYKQVEEEGILLHTTDCTFFGLNETGVFLWRRIDGKLSVARLAEELGREFDIPPDEAQRDVADWAGKLIDAGLIELA